MNRLWRRLEIQVQDTSVPSIYIKVKIESTLNDTEVFQKGSIIQVHEILSNYLRYIAIPKIVKTKQHSSSTC